MSDDWIDGRPATAVLWAELDRLRSRIAAMEAGLRRPLYERICECGDFESQHQGGGPCSVCCQRQAPYDGCEIFRVSGFEKLTDTQKGLTEAT